MTHDLGHKIFIILSGRAEFKISGETRELGLGQMCYALADEPHRYGSLGMSRCRVERIVSTDSEGSR
jgi:quercetin dioxygenase-like cupin family protein